MKYEFASREWCAALHGIIAERAAVEIKTKPNLTMSVCEVFSNAPAHLADKDGKLAWSAVVQGDKIDVRPAERDDVKVKVHADYQTCVPLGQFSTDGDPARAAKLQSMVAAAVAAGKLTFVGERAATPDSMTSIHDAIARLTA
jgi:hypothetical protein